MAGAVAQRLDTIRDRTGMSSREVAQVLDTTPQTVSRWQTGRAWPQPRHLDKLLTLEWIADQLAQFYEPDEAHLWIFSPHALLNGDRPAQLIIDGRSDEVLELIEQLQTGSYL